MSWFVFSLLWPPGTAIQNCCRVTLLDMINVKRNKHIYLNLGMLRMLCVDTGGASVLSTARLLCVCMYARDNVHQEGPSTLHVPRARASKPARPSPHIVVPVVGARKSSTQPNHGYWRCACFDVSCTAAVLRAHAVRGYKDVEISGMTCGVLRVDVETAEALASVFSADEQTRHQKRVDFSLLEPRSPVPGRRRTQVGGAGGGKHLLVKVNTF